MEQETRNYNGWTNYETWAVNLWLDNDESTYTYWREETERHRKDSADKDAAICSLAEQLKTEITDAAPTDEPSLYSDLLNGALAEVNWAEIANTWITEK